MTVRMKFMILMVAVLTLAACKSKEPKPTAPVEQEPTRSVDTQPAETFPWTGKPATDPAHLNNPDSLLSKRVIYFDFDRAEVKAEYRALVRAHAEFAAANRGWQMTLEGHADERGTREYNLGLGERRAHTVRDLMRAQGAGMDQIDSVSFGEERPVEMCHEESCWWKNRRVEIVYTQN